MTSDLAADHRSRKVAGGIAIFLREIQRALPAAVGDDDRLQRHDHADQRQRGRERRSIAGRRRERWRRGETRRDEGQERDELERRRDLLKAAADAYAHPLQGDEAEEQGDGDRRDGAAERRHEQRHELAHADRHVSEDGAVGEPVGPADSESDRVAERAPRVHVVAACPREHGAELGQAHRSEQRVEAADDPHREDGRTVAELGRHQPRRPQNADPERAADDDRQAEADAENAQKTGCGGLRGGGVDGSVGHGQSGALRLVSEL